ncbi:hypothetical protein VTO58DRAFT_108192 [Aureobasidium pullulans]
MPKEVKQKSGLARGLNAGHKVTPRQPAPRRLAHQGRLPVSPPTSAALLNFFATPRTSVPASSQRED